MSENQSTEMKAKLREYMDTIFADAPDSEEARELKEEMTTNLLDRYDDLLSEGKTPALAYNMAVSGVGDISGLLADLAGKAHTPAPTALDEQAPQERSESGYRSQTENTQSGWDAKQSIQYMTEEERSEVRRYRIRSATLTAVAVALYIMCVIPVMLLERQEILGVSLMFGMIAIATCLLICNGVLRPDRMRASGWYRSWGPVDREQARLEVSQYRTRAALMTSVGVALYIVCWIPCMFSETSLIGPALLFVLVAVATGLMILSSMTRPEILRHKQLAQEAGVHADASERDEDDEDGEDSKSSGRPHNRPDTWESDADARRRKQGRQVCRAITGALWMLTVIAYLAVSFFTGGWAYTWLMFLMAAAVDNIIKAVFDLVA